MSNVFTYTTEIKLNRDNQLLVKYISDYLPIFNKIQRIAFHRIKKSYIQNGKFDNKSKKKLYSELKEEFDLTSRTINSIIYNMLGRFESIKELKSYELNQLYRRREKIESDLEKLLDERTLIKLSKINQKDVSKENLQIYKNLKIKIYWKHNKLNTINQKIKNLEAEIETYKFKICFGKKENLNKDYKAFVKQRDSELYFLGCIKEYSCNNNFRLEYNKKDNKFYFRVRKEIDLENGKYEYGKVYFNKKHKYKLKELLANSSSPLTYRIKIKDDKILLQVIFQYKYTKENCITRQTNGVIGVDFNKGFVSVSETDKYGNLINNFNIDYRFSSGNKTVEDFKQISSTLSKLCLETGKDLAIEKLNFNVKKSQITKGSNKKYNKMLSSLAYSKFDRIITSKCTKDKIFLHKVTPAWTSYIALHKYCNNKKLNIHSGASFVIARRGQALKDSVKQKSYS